MIRTKTTMVIGAGASCELELPDGAEMLAKIAGGFDFTRAGSDTQSRDLIKMGQHFEKFSRRVGASDAQLQQAAMKLRTAARIGNSIDGVLEQLSTDQLVQAAGKLAIVYYTLQAEARSPLGNAPREQGDLPLRGNENWLYHLGRLITTGVPRSKAENCFDNLNLICFNYDRSIQHYLPFVLEMAFGMTLIEARQLVGERLNIIHPYGRAGRLPWEPGDSPDVDWGVDDPWNLHNLVKEIHTGSERGRNRSFAAALQEQMVSAKRLVFLGFGFDPQNMDFLFDSALSHEPDVMAAITGLNDAEYDSVNRMLKRKTGIANEQLITVLDTRSFQLLRDYRIFLES